MDDTRLRQIDAMSMLEFRTLPTEEQREYLETPMPTDRIVEILAIMARRQSTCAKRATP